jgi:hypothetical protein
LADPEYLVTGEVDGESKNQLKIGVIAGGAWLSGDVAEQQISTA